MIRKERACGRKFTIYSLWRRENLRRVFVKKTVCERLRVWKDQTIRKRVLKEDMYEKKGTWEDKIGKRVWRVAYEKKKVYEKKQPRKGHVCEKKGMWEALQGLNIK
jgi:hypothetical protein